MKNEEIFSRIVSQRLSRQNREYWGFKNFMDKISRSDRLLKNISKSVKDKISIEEGLAQYVIADITAFEIFLRDTFFAIFRLCKNEQELMIKCSKLVENKFSIEDLVKIKYDNYEIPEIIMQYQNFQNLSSIEKVFSTLMGKKFFIGLNDREFQSGGSTNITFKLERNWYPELEKYLDLRHQLTHDFDPNLKLDRKMIDKYHSNLLLFIVAADEYIHKDFIEPNLRDEFI